MDARKFTLLRDHNVNTLANTKGCLLRKRVIGFTEDDQYPFPIDSDFFEVNPGVFAGVAAFDGAEEVLQKSGPV